MNLKRIIAAILSVAIMGATAPMTQRNFYKTALTVNADEETYVTYDTWQEAYRDTLLDFMYSGAYSSRYDDVNICSTYAIHDMNGDGIPELFINQQPINASYSVLYTFYDSKVIQLALLPRAGAGFVSYCTDDGLIKTSDGGGYVGYVVTNYSHIINGQMVTVDSFNIDYGTVPYTYSRNGNVISEEEYYSDLEQYESKNWTRVGRENYFDDLFCQVDNITYAYYFDYYEAYHADYSTADTISIKNYVNGLPVKWIGQYFLADSGASVLNLPENIQNYYYYGFNGYSLTTINVDSSNPYYTSKDGVMYSKDMTKIIKFPTAKDTSSYIFPQSVTEIDRFAFA